MQAAVSLGKGFTKILSTSPSHLSLNIIFFCPFATCCAPTPMSSKMPGSLKGRVTSLDKKYLVWSGQFKSSSEIPPTLEEHVLNKARSWGRIRLNLVFLAIGAVGAVAMVYSGKQAAKRGETVEKMNLEWHRKINEEHRRSQPPPK